MASVTATCTPRSLKGLIRGNNFMLSIYETETTDVTVQGLVQAFEISFNRKLTRVYDLTSPVFYYIEAPTDGQVAFTNIVGRAGAPKLSCSCSPKTLVLSPGDLACEQNTIDNVPSTFTMLDALPHGLRIQGSAGSGLVVYNISYIFNELL
jgi:hypothetical protein